MILGKMNAIDADCFVLENSGASLGSLSSGGLRRVSGSASLIDAFANAGGIVSNQILLHEIGNNGDSENQCIHLGSKRRCCDALYICRETPGTDCVLRGPAVAPVRSCEVCEKRVGLSIITK